MVLFFFDKLQIVLIFVPLGAVEYEIWLEHALYIKISLPNGVQLVDVKHDFVTSALTND